MLVLLLNSLLGLPAASNAFPTARCRPLGALSTANALLRSTGRAPGLLHSSI